MGGREGGREVGSLDCRVYAVFCLWQYVNNSFVRLTGYSKEEAPRQASHGHYEDYRRAV